MASQLGDPFLKGITRLLVRLTVPASSWYYIIIPALTKSDLRSTIQLNGLGNPVMSSLSLERGAAAFAAV